MSSKRKVATVIDIEEIDEARESLSTTQKEGPSAINLAIRKLHDEAPNGMGIIPSPAEALNTKSERFTLDVDTVKIKYCSPLEKSVYERLAAQPTPHPHLIPIVHVGNSEVEVSRAHIELSTVWAMHVWYERYTLKGPVRWGPSLNIADVFLKVCHAVMYLHNTCGIHHNDIRMANILLNITKEGVISDVFLADFNLAMTSPSQLKKFERSLNESVAFSFEFLFLDRNAYTTNWHSGQSDVYMLAALLLEMMNARSTELKANDARKMAAKDTFEPSAESTGCAWSENKKIQRQLFALIKISLHNRASRRPSLSEFVASVEGILAGFGLD